MRARAVALVTALTLPRVAHAQEPPKDADLPCDPLGDFACVYAPGSGNTELRTVIDPGEWNALPISPSHFGGAVGLGPGTLSDSVGVGLGGGTALETVFELDGFDVSGIYYGGPSDASPVPLSMLGRMVVRRGGMGAALRGSSAGQVSLTGGGTRDGIEVYAGDFNGSSDLREPPSIIDWDLSRNRFDAHVLFGGGMARWRTRWFAGVGFHTRSGSYTRTVNRAVDANQNGVPDEDVDGNLIVEPVETLNLDSDGSSLPVLVKIAMEPELHQQVVFTGFVDWTRDDVFSTVAGEPEALARTNSDLTTDLIGRWRGAYGNTELSLLAGYHRHHSESLSSYGERNLLPGGFVRLGDDWLDHESATVQQACRDSATDDYPLIANCPLSFYWAGGVGDIVDNPSSRSAGRLQARHYLDLYGEHLLQGGVDLDQTRYTHHYEYSGGLGEQFLADDRYVDLGDGSDSCAGEPCRWLGSLNLRSVARSASVFLADDYSPFPSLTVSAGGRYEVQDLEDVATLSDFVPRLGVAWDPLGRGRARLFAATGAYLGRMPLVFADGIKPGPDMLRQVIDPDTEQVVDEQVFESPAIPVAAGIGPLRVNELLGGGEIALGEELRAGISYMRREMGRIVEDADGEVTNPFGRRDLDEFSLELRSNPARPLAMRAAYTYTRLRGSWSGFVDDTLFETNAGLHRLFDDTELATNADGPLPSERAHTLDVGLSYRQRIPGGNLVVGLRAIAASGIPLNAVGGGVSDRVFLLPRGSLGHAPEVTSTSLRVQYATRRGFTFFADAINLFDRQEPARINENYTYDDVRPIVGGSREDLIFLKRLDFGGGGESNVPASRNPTFGQPTGLFSPWSIWFGLRVGY